jgi:hypothetical protein
MKITRLRRTTLLTSLSATMPTTSSAQRLGPGGWSGGALELTPEETVQGDRQEQLGAALRCVASIETRAHGLVIFAGGAKDVLLVARIASPHDAAATWAGERGGGASGARQIGGKCKLVSTHRVPAAKGLMLRFMALEAFEHPSLGTDVAGVLAATDDGMIRLLFYHFVRQQWHIGAELRSLSLSLSLARAPYVSLVRVVSLWMQCVRMRKKGGKRWGGRERGT